VDCQKAASDPERSAKTAPRERKKNSNIRMEVRSSEGENTHAFFRKVLGKVKATVTPC
jgi:hypothetical protein